MDKAVEALNSVYRALLAVCALLAILAVGATEDPRADTHALYALRDLRNDHAHLTLEMAAHLTGYYRAQMLAVAAPAQKRFLAQSRFGTWSIDLVWDRPEAAPQEPPHVTPLDGGVVTVGNLLDLASRPSRGLLHRYRFDDPVSLRRALGQLLDPSNEAFVAGSGFVKVGPSRQTAGSCTITAGPFRPADEIDLQRGFDAKCSEDGPPEPIAVADFGIGFLNVDLASSAARLRQFADKPAVRHANELQLLSAEEVSKASSDVELFGLKVPKPYLLLGGPALITLLLVQLWSQLHVAARAEPADADTGAGLAWFGLFSGHVKLFMLVSLVAFPTLVCLGLTIVHVRQLAPGSVTGAYVLVAVETIVPLIVASAAWRKSVRLAATWGAGRAADPPAKTRPAKSAGQVTPSAARR